MSKSSVSVLSVGVVCECTALFFFFFFFFFEVVRGWCGFIGSGEVRRLSPIRDSELPLDIVGTANREQGGR